MNFNNWDLTSNRKRLLTN